MDDVIPSLVLKRSPTHTKHFSKSHLLSSPRAPLNPINVVRSVCGVKTGGGALRFLPALSVNPPQLQESLFTSLSPTVSLWSEARGATRIRNVR